jgi:ABC-type glycerol-3-phosphate transport system substrate-binding protein
MAALTVVALVASGSVALAGGGVAMASSSKSINVLVEAGGAGELAPIAKLYKKDTGVTVNLITLPYQGLYDKVNSELSSGAVSFDVASLDAVWLPAFAPGLDSMNSFYTPAVKADNFPSVLQEAKVDGKYVGVSDFANAEVLYYRKDLFDNAANKAAFKKEFGFALAPPSNWQQYYDVAKFFTKNGMYGAPLVGDEETTYLATLSQAGEKHMVLNAAGTSSTLGDAASLKALNYYTSLAKFGPSGAASVDWNAAQNLFNQGKAAMMIFWGHAYRQIPKNSPAYGKTGVAPMIAGPAGIGTVPGPYYLVIPKGTPNQTPAMNFVKFAYAHNSLSADTSLGLVSRLSAFRQFENKPGYASYKPMLTSLNAPGTITRPPNAQWDNIVTNVLIPMIQKAVTAGDNPKNNEQLLKQAAQQVDSIVQK